MNSSNNNQKDCPQVIKDKETGKDLKICCACPEIEYHVMNAH